MMLIVQSKNSFKLVIIEPQNVDDNTLVVVTISKMSEMMVRITPLTVLTPDQDTMLSQTRQMILLTQH